MGERLLHPPTPVCSSPVGTAAARERALGQRKNTPGKRETSLLLFTVIAKQKQIIRLRERRWDYLGVFNEALVGL